MTIDAPDLKINWICNEHEVDWGRCTVDQAYGKSMGGYDINVTCKNITICDIADIPSESENKFINAVVKFLCDCVIQHKLTWSSSLDSYLWSLLVPYAYYTLVNNLIHRDRLDVDG